MKKTISCLILFVSLIILITSSSAQRQLSINKYQKPSNNYKKVNIATLEHAISRVAEKIDLKIKSRKVKDNYAKVINTKANSKEPLNIKTYDGHDQPMHPDIVYIDKGFNGYKYWMAYTPYPNMNDDFENPCIGASNDGINWDTPKSIRNPIVLPPDDMEEGGHFSDTDIVYDNGNLYVYFVYNKMGVLGPSRFYRVASKDGINWSKAELVYKCTAPNPISGYSPGVIKGKAGYKMWYTSEGNTLSMISSKDGKEWSDYKKCNINIDGWTVWHVNVIETDLGYEGLMCATDKKIKNRALFYIKSSDGINWESSSEPIIYPTKSGWDSSEIYRSTFLKQNGVYRVWYSAKDPERRWHIGYSEGETPETLNGL